MFAAYPSSDDLFASHWVVVIGVGLAFFVVQIMLAARFYLRVGRQDATLRELRRNFHQVGDGRGAPATLPQHFTFLRWVLARFPADAKSQPDNPTREVVLQELDSRIASDSDYLLLQRMGVMAPLLGVVLTVVGFFWLDVGDGDEQSLQNILLAVTPLISGVGAGAVLALVNQALLHWVGVRVESLRNSARDWFDAVFPYSASGTEQPASKGRASLERLASLLDDSARRQSQHMDQIDQSIASIKSAASHVDELTKLFHAEIKDVAHVLHDLRIALADSANALTELIPMGSRAVANLDVSVAAFRTTIDRQFTDAATRHHRAGNLLAESVQHIADATRQLQLSSGELLQTAESNKISSTAIDQSLREHLVAGNQQFYSAVQSLTVEVAVLTKVVRALSQKVETMASQFNLAALPTSQSLDGTVQDLTRRPR